MHTPTIPGRSAVRRGVAAIGAVALVATACAVPSQGPVPAPGETTTTTIAAQPAPSTTLPDLTARPMTFDELVLMLPDGVTGPARGAPAITPRTNDYLVSGSTGERDDEAADIAAHHRQTGVAASYEGPAGTTHVWIDVLGDADDAHRYLVDAVGDIAKRIGGSHDPAAIAETTDGFPVDGVGEEAFGMEIRLGDGSVETAVLARVGRVVIFVSLVRPEPGDDRVAAQYLAGDVASAVVDVLLAVSPVTDRRLAGPASYRFEHTQAVTVGAITYRLHAAGVVVGHDVSCRVELTAPGWNTRRSLLRIDDLVWSGADTGDLRGGGGNLTDRSLLGLCPAWPIDLGAAGLSAVATGTPATHVVNGVPALGFTGDAAVLEGAVGVRDVAVDVFNVWVAESTPWMVELDLVVEGDAADLAPLLGPGWDGAGRVRVTIDHRVTEIDGGHELAPPAG